MEETELTQLRKHSWMESRIPASDALSTFIADGSGQDLWEIQAGVGRSRLYPVNGGHRVLIPFDGGPYDSSRFTIESGAWDHEHCDVCNASIPAMALCYVTKAEQPYFLLCADCYGLHVASKVRKPWWKFW